MISEGLRKHAFWLYGVIVGLAIKDALETVIGHLITPPGGSMRDAVPETMRLLAFLLTSIQFYLGSVWFFDKFYPDNVTPERAQGYAVDYLFGLAHFVFFFAWAMSIDYHQGPLRLFPILTILILMYDALWCVASRGRETYNEIRKWAWVNFGAVAMSIAVYCILYLILLTFEIGRDVATRHRLVEPIALLPIVAISIVDIIGMVTDKQIIADWVIARFKS